MVEIIPKPTERMTNWQNILFYLFFGLLLLTVFSYSILNYYLKKAESTSKNLEETLAREKTAEEITLEKEVFGYQKKIEDFSKLIKSHLFPSKFFEFIEKNSHPQVWFSRLDLNLRKGELKISGQAENFVVLDQQLQIFKANPLVKNFDLVKITIGKEGKVDFDLNLDLKSSFVTPLLVNPVQFIFKDL